MADWTVLTSGKDGGAGPTRLPTTTSGGRSPTSIRVGAEDLTSATAAQSAVADQADAILDELDRPVAQQEVRAAGVEADESLGGSRVAAAVRGRRRLPVVEAVGRRGRVGVGIPT